MAWYMHPKMTQKLKDLASELGIIPNNGHQMKSEKRPGYFRCTYWSVKSDPQNESVVIIISSLIIMNHVYVHYVRKGGSKTGYKNSTARFFATAQMCTAAVAPALCEPSNACGHR